MKGFAFLLVLLFWLPAARACPVCRPKVEAGIYDAAYSANVLVVLLPVAVMVALGLGLFYWDKFATPLTRPHATARP